MPPITGRIMQLEFFANRGDGFTRFALADHPAPHTVLLGFEATLTVNGAPVTFPELMAWIVRPGGVSVGTFYPDTARYGAVTRADFTSDEPPGA